MVTGVIGLPYEVRTRFRVPFIDVPASVAIAICPCQRGVKPRSGCGGNSMTLVRREFLRLAAASAVAPSLSPIAWAQGYPTRAVRIIVAFPPRRPAHTTAPLIAHSPPERLY